MMPNRLKLSVACGAAPLAAGIVIYLLWRITEWHGLYFFGIANILAGVFFFLVGAVSLAWHLRDDQGVQRTRRHPLWLEGILVGGLLLINFPVAAYLTYSVWDVMTRCTVTVLNEGDRPIDGLVLTGPGVQTKVGRVPGGARRTRHLHVRGDGALAFAGQLQDRPIGGTVDGYVTSGMGGAVTLRVKADGTYEVEWVRPAQGD